jgi:DNA-binding CsgD family transcriptional regulator
MNEALLQLAESKLASLHQELALKKTHHDSKLFYFAKTTDSIYLGCNDAFANIAGYSDAKTIIGKTDKELIWDEYTLNLYLAGDKKVVNERLTLVDQHEPLSDNHNYKGEVFGSKQPMFTATGELVGIIGCYEVVDLSTNIFSFIAPNTIDFLLGAKNQFQVKYHYEKFLTLTRRETAVILYLIIGCSLKEIAYNMNISARTIDSYHVVSLKNKFHCHSISSLIKALLRSDFLNNFTVHPN